MTKHRQGINKLVTIASILLVCLLAAGVYAWHQQSLTGNKTVIVEIKNSGSTNFKGWDLYVYADGSAMVDCSAGLQLHTSCSSASYGPSTFSANTLTSDLSKTKLDPQYTCIRSTSFGSTETLMYKNTSVSGIDCYFSTTPDASLSRDITPFLQKAHL
jgi:hypothetical protein